MGGGYATSRLDETAGFGQAGCSEAAHIRLFGVVAKRNACPPLAGATAEQEGTAAHSVQERAERAIAPNVSEYLMLR